jgi:hypothetical protein
MDVYFCDTTFQKMRIIDFGPLVENESSGILFEWVDLLNIIGSKNDAEDVNIRVINSDDECRLGFMRLNSIPVDWEQLMAINREKQTIE